MASQTSGTEQRKRAKSKSADLFHSSLFLFFRKARKGENTQEMNQVKDMEVTTMNEKSTIPTTEPVSEKQVKPTKSKRNSNRKLTKCYEQQAKLLEQKSTVNKKVEEIDKCISENDAIIAELENKELFKICKKKGISTQVLIGFLKKIPEGVTLENAAKTAFGQMPANSEQLHL